MSAVAPEKPRLAATPARHPGEGRDPTSFPRYPKYKDSGVEWLGEVPTHWKIAPLKRCYSVCLGKMLQTDAKNVADELADYVRAANIQKSGIDVSDVKQMWFSQDELKQLALRSGDLLVSEGGDVGRCAIWNSQLRVCYFQNSINRVRARGSNSTRFLAYWLSAAKGGGLIEVICNKSTIAHFTAEKVAAIQTPIPSAAEQEQIATFLDHETAKIDALIAEQEKLIALLKEKRQALISHAVTKGLDPNAPMKDSGIAWLGAVPRHWQMRTISSLSTKITNGYVGPTRNILVDDGVRYLQSLHIKNNSIRFDTPYFVRPEWSNAHAKSILATGDLLIVQTGDIGQVAVVTDEFVGCNCHALIIVAPVHKVVAGQYLSLVLNSAYGFHSLISIQTGALHPHLNCGNVKDVLIPVPPIEEQRRIIDVTERQTCTLQGLVTEAEHTIELLKERRAALISAAVTGKIDVRGYAEVPAETFA